MRATPSPSDLAPFLDFALLRPDATAQDIEQLCSEARTRRLHGVCVYGSRVEQARHLLEETELKIVCAVGFPFGTAAGDVKRFEVEAAIDDGAHEIDLVLHVGMLKDGNDRLLLRELRDVVEAADERPVTVMLQTGLLNRDEIARACQLCDDAGVQGIGALSDFSESEAAAETIKLLKDSVDPKFEVKVCGDIRDTKIVLATIDSGATRVSVPVLPSL